MHPVKFKVRIGKGTKQGMAGPRDLETELAREGFQHSFSWTDSPGAIYPPHDHEYSHRVIVVSGRIEFTVDGVSYLLGPSDEIDLPRGTVHSARTIGDAPVTYIIAQK